MKNKNKHITMIEVPTFNEKTVGIGALVQFVAHGYDKTNGVVVGVDVNATGITIEALDREDGTRHLTHLSAQFIDDGRHQLTILAEPNFNRVLNTKRT